MVRNCGVITPTTTASTTSVTTGIHCRSMPRSMRWTSVLTLRPRPCRAGSPGRAAARRRLGRDPLDDVARRRHVADQPDRLADEDAHVLGVAGRHPVEIGRPLGVDASSQLVLVAVPALGERVAQDPPGEFRRPGVAADDVDRLLADRAVAIGRQAAACQLGWTSASRLAQKREPISTPSAPSISAAARPRPSAMPPAASSNVSGLRSASRSATSGTSVSVPRVAPWPPASLPCATMTSAPTSIASRAWPMVWTWQIKQAARRSDGAARTAWDRRTTA